MYDLEIKPSVDKIFLKIAKKDKVLLVKIDKEIQKVRENPYKRFTYLKGNLKGLNRIHVADHFVLIFEVNHEKKIVTVIYFAHHDDAY